MLSNNQAVVLLLSLNSVPLGFVAYSTAHPRIAGASTSSQESTKAYPVLKLDGVLVQLGPAQEETKSRYLAIDLDLELEDDSVRGSIIQRLPRVRESILAYFSDRTAPQLESAGALLALKDDLRGRLNDLLPTPRIRTVFVTQFIIQ
jgi:flagellar basal body-associated protein FliL